MKLSDLGEDALVARWTRGLPRNATLLVGPGDDCAVVGRRTDALWTLLKTDCVIEGVHFTGATDFARVGWKALARNVSVRVRSLSPWRSRGGWNGRVA